MRLFWIVGPKAKYSSFNWWENFMGGHISIGPVTVFGSNAMYWVVVIRTKKWGFMHITLPALHRKGSRGYCFYISPNGTPGYSTFYRGPVKNEVEKSRMRERALGHNFDSDNDYNCYIVRDIDNKF